MASGPNIHHSMRHRKPVQFTLSAEERAAVDELAERHGVAASVVVGRGMRWLRDRGIDLSSPPEEKSTDP